MRWNICTCDEFYFRKFETKHKYSIHSDTSFAAANYYLSKTCSVAVTRRYWMELQFTCKSTTCNELDLVGWYMKHHTHSAVNIFYIHVKLSKCWIKCGMQSIFHLLLSESIFKVECKATRRYRLCHAQWQLLQPAHLIHNTKLNYTSDMRNVQIRFFPLWSGADDCVRHENLSIELCIARIWLNWIEHPFLRHLHLQSWVAGIGLLGIARNANTAIRRHRCIGGQKFSQLKWWPLFVFIIHRENFRAYFRLQVTAA